MFLMEFDHIQTKVSYFNMQKRKLQLAHDRWRTNTKDKLESGVIGGGFDLYGIERGVKVLTCNLDPLLVGV